MSATSLKENEAENTYNSGAHTTSTSTSTTTSISPSSSGPCYVRLSAYPWRSALSTPPAPSYEIYPIANIEIRADDYSDVTVDMAEVSAAEARHILSVTGISEENIKIITDDLINNSLAITTWIPSPNISRYNYPYEVVRTALKQTGDLEEGIYQRIPLGDYHSIAEILEHESKTERKQDTSLTSPSSSSSSSPSCAASPSPSPSVYVSSLARRRVYASGENSWSSLDLQQKIVWSNHIKIKYDYCKSETVIHHVSPLADGFTRYDIIMTIAKQYSLLSSSSLLTAPLSGVGLRFLRRPLSLRQGPLLDEQMLNAYVFVPEEELVYEMDQ